MSLITKLASIPEDVSTFPVEEGMHAVVLTFKTDAKTQTRKPPVAYVVPKLSNFTGNTPQSNATNKWIDSLQRAALSEYNAGAFEFHNLITDLDALFTDYVTDNRGNRTGVKQSEMMDWITDVLVPFFTAKLEANLHGFTVEQKQNTLAAYVKKFKLAATRGNKAGDESLNDAALKDLEQRFNLWTTNEDEAKNLPKSPELDCLMERIATHRKVIAKSMEEITTGMF